MRRSAFDKKLDEALRYAEKNMGRDERESARQAGVPFFFGDEHGRLIKEYPDSKRSQIVVENGVEKEIPLTEEK